MTSDVCVQMMNEWPYTMCMHCMEKNCEYICSIFNDINKQKTMLPRLGLV